ncbi:hypothetical protein CBR_g37539 [Chara braunii]|uniref:Ribosomal protein L46 N-terminal domain-containing protein n=1 Tax=Chara braunii TaxID=69332 RepID=A0A388LN46_CHABU|nr:hypothetical protein CBR_g37539 [Chara braunii]|eukprot:GBG83738.1 hypothetical protein CBR_g37539 [Chara braunii]
MVPSGLRRLGSCAAAYRGTRVCQRYTGGSGLFSPIPIEVPHNRGLLAGSRSGPRLQSFLHSTGCPSESSSADQRERLLAACVLERLPVVLPELPIWESDFQTFCFERQQQERKEPPDEFLDAASSLGREDDDLEFEPAPCITEADRKNDRRSLNRALAQRLYLIVYGKSALQPDSKQPVWHFPLVEHSAGETIRQAAERALVQRLGSGMDVYFVGNAPCGHLERSEPISKVFFFRSQILKGSIELQGGIKDYAWVTKAELADYFDHTQSEDHKLLMQKMLSS